MITLGKRKRKAVRKKKRVWTLLYRKENGQSVWLYEPLRRYEIIAKEKKGWKVWE